MAELKRILHVDDEADIREVAKMTLEAIGGFTVETCGSGHEALQMASNFAPDLILLDVMMPGMDGPMTLQELHKAADTVRIPVVFMTAKAQSHEVAQFLDIGAVGIITKPFDPMTLSQQISDIWNSLQ